MYRYAATTTSAPAQPTTSPSAASTTTLPAAAGCRDRLAGGERANGALAVYDLPSGTLRWEAGISVPDEPFQVPFAVVGDLVVVKDGDTLWALDAATCDVRWELPGRQVLTVAGAGGLVSVVDSIALRALDATGGEQRWSFGMRWEPPEPPAAVAFAAGAPRRRRPAAPSPRRRRRVDRAGGPRRRRSGEARSRGGTAARGGRRPGDRLHAAGAPRLDAGDQRRRGRVSLLRFGDGFAAVLSFDWS